jgi:hypothetical protein
LCNVVQFFFHMNQQELHFLNQAFMVLLPKKHDPISIADFRSISFAKIISKLMANRLGPELRKLISINQIAFIIRN